MKKTSKILTFVGVLVCTAVAVLVMLMQRKNSEVAPTHPDTSKPGTSRPAAGSADLGQSVTDVNTNRGKGDNVPEVIAPKAEEVVLDLLANENPRIRQKALELLDVWRPELLKARLASILEYETDAGCVLVALFACEKQGVMDAVPQVLKKLHSKDPAIRRKAASTLGKMGDLMPPQQREEAGVVTAEALESELADRGHSDRAADMGALMPYFSALGMLKSKNAAPLLLKHLRIEKEPMVRRWVALALDHVAKEEHMSALKSAWRSESDNGVRLAIEGILGRAPFNLEVDRKKMELVSKPVN